MKSGRGKKQGKGKKRGKGKIGPSQRQNPKIGDQTDEIAKDKGRRKTHTDQRKCSCGFEGSDDEFAKHKYNCIKSQQGESEEASQESEKKQKFRDWKNRLREKIGKGDLNQVSGNELKKFCKDANECYPKAHLLRLMVEEKIREIERQEEALRKALQKTLDLDEWGPGPVKKIWGEKQRKPATKNPKGTAKKGSGRKRARRKTGGPQRPKR